LLHHTSSLADADTAATTNDAATTLESIPEETEADLQEEDFLVKVFDPTDQQLVQSGKEAAQDLQRSDLSRA